MSRNHFEEAARREKAARLMSCRCSHAGRHELPRLRIEGTAMIRCPLPAAPPPESWTEAAPPTDVDAAPAPMLDPYLLAGARRDAGAAELHLVLGEPLTALDAARRARELLDYAIRAYERAAFVTTLAEAE